MILLSFLSVAALVSADYLTTATSNAVVRGNIETLAERWHYCHVQLLRVQHNHYLQHLCRTTPAVATIANFGLEEATHQCIKLMKFARWDCTVQGITNYTILQRPPILKDGNPESAFFIALSSAGIAWSISTACVQGKLTSCSCGHDYAQSNSVWHWGGCSYGVKFALKTARKLLDDRYIGGMYYERRPNIKQAYRHNERAGRMAVKYTLKKHCRCHGVSGSCEMKTCWEVVSNMDSVGQHILHKYMQAQPLTNTEHNNNTDDEPSNDSIDDDIYDDYDAERRLRRHYYMNRDRRQLMLTASDLVYVNYSPNYCVPQPAIAHWGTTNRECSIYNGTHTIGNCEHMCCKRGYVTYQRAKTYKCKCKFVWCCKVECELCSSDIFISYCR